MSLVQIEFQRPTVISNDRRPARELSSRIELLLEDGKKGFLTYVDPYTGDPRRPRVPCEVDTSTDRGKKNLAYFQAYRDLYAPQLVIIDPDKVKAEEVDTRKARLEAENYVEALHKEGKWATMADLLRRLEGPVGEVTHEALYLRLARIAEQTPQRINSVRVDPDLDTKVTIDKAVEAGRLLLKENRYYYLPDRQTPVADGMDKMVYQYTTDRQLREYIDAAPEQVKPTGKGKKAAAPKEYLRYAQPVAAPAATPAGLTLVDEERKMAEAEIEAVAKSATTSGYLIQEDGAWVLPGGVKAATEAEVITFYKQNPRQAEALKGDLEAYGML